MSQAPNYKFKFETLVEHCKRQDAVIAELRYDLNVSRLYQDGAVWFWAGDGTDNLETLACPVVINAGDLRAMLAASHAGQPADEQPAAQEPVAWIVIDEPFHGTSGVEAGEWDVEFERKAIDTLAAANSPGRIALYAAPSAAEQPAMDALGERQQYEKWRRTWNGKWPRPSDPGEWEAWQARAAISAAEQPDTARTILTDEDMRRLRRFHEICEDSDAGGHDLPKEAVRRLECAGALRSCGFGRHEITLFGDYLLGKDGEA